MGQGANCLIDGLFYEALLNMWRSMAKWLTHQIVVLAFVGSIPTSSPHISLTWGVAKR